MSTGPAVHPETGLVPSTPSAWLSPVRVYSPPPGACSPGACPRRAWSHGGLDGASRARVSTLLLPRERVWLHGFRSPSTERRLSQKRAECTPASCSCLLPTRARARPALPCVQGLAHSRRGMDARMKEHIEGLGPPARNVRVWRGPCFEVPAGVCPPRPRSAASGCIKTPFLGGGSSSPP